MLRIAEQALPEKTAALLKRLQSEIDALESYGERVGKVGRAWENKTSTKEKEEAFGVIRATLRAMCAGPERCSYCEDSLAWEIEHILPKSLFPGSAFVWENYLFSCGSCNSSKGNKYAEVVGETVRPFAQRASAPEPPPGLGVSAFVNPRCEDPTAFLELDLGGVTDANEYVPGTFHFLPREELDRASKARAKYTVEVLGLNRDGIWKAREADFEAFQALLSQYVRDKENGADERRLQELRSSILKQSHLTVFAEMRRQRAFLPKIDALLTQAPEAAEWPLIPPPAP